MTFSKKKALFWVMVIYILCNIVRYIEFLFIKTDKTFLSENIICKLFTIAVIFFVLYKLGWKWQTLGFVKNHFLKNALFGLALGISTFTISYFIENIILLCMGKHPHINFFITNFAISNQNISSAAFATVLVCVIGNIVNVWAEEGLFRGLLFKIMKETYTEKQSNFFQALLFGLWHIVTVIVWLTEGSINILPAILLSVGYVILSGILAYEWGMCIGLAGTIWVGAFEHFFNNFVTNSLHTVTETGIDEMQIIRIVLSNILSLIFVLLISKKKSNR